MARFVPVGVFAFVLAFGLVLWINRGRCRHGQAKVSAFPVAAFCMYAVILFTITFLSRESGSGDGIDLELFSTLGINDRNNAYVLENILLFVPYSFFAVIGFGRYRKVYRAFFLCLFTSLVIECLQYITARGVFQLDDILTNVLGGVLGILLGMLFAPKSC